MIAIEERSAIDQAYFEIIGINGFSVTLRSRNTGHEWHLLEQVANGHRTFVISHRHGPPAPFHLQVPRPTVADCCGYIKSHDAYHLEKIRKKKERRLRRLGLIPPDGQV